MSTKAWVGAAERLQLIIRADQLIDSPGSVSKLSLQNVRRQSGHPRTAPSRTNWPIRDPRAASCQLQDPISLVRQRDGCDRGLRHALRRQHADFRQEEGLCDQTRRFLSPACSSPTIHIHEGRDGAGDPCGGSIELGVHKRDGGSAQGSTDSMADMAASYDGASGQTGTSDLPSRLPRPSDRESL